MKIKIQAADWKNYNANSSGNQTGDCVKRSLSLALDIPYSEISKLLNIKMREKKRDKWNIRAVYFPVMKDFGCSDWIVCKDDKGNPMTLREFVDTVADPNKTYLVHTGQKITERGNVKTNHLVCVRDGKVWDSWDSRSQYVDDYSIAPTNSKKISDGVNIQKIADNVAEPTIVSQIMSFVKKQGWDLDMLDTEVVRSKNFQIKSSAMIALSKTDWIDKKRYYSFDIYVTLEPTMTQEEAEEHVKKIAKIRTYDRMYAIKEQEKKLKEEEEVKHQLQSKTSRNNEYYLNGREQRFYNSLPGWIKPLITWIYIHNPGQYSDSYIVSIRPHPNDTKHQNKKRITFEAEESWMIKDMIDRYKNRFEIPYEDYDPYEEY